MKKCKIYNLEERTYVFARDCRLLVRDFSKTINNIEDGKQLVRSSGSIGANYIEANEKLGDKDFLMWMKIARKEAKESGYWLRLLWDMNDSHRKKINELKNEALEIKKILSAIINKSSTY
ncbi:four helix bundle protein [Ulvibacterium sp.]|uniref:four helix bundle protein n=1 Tax=Ulvibacterium sp. TaxID=2665914 RepID=UPI003CC69DCB